LKGRRKDMALFQKKSSIRMPKSIKKRSPYLNVVNVEKNTTGNLIELKNLNCNKFKFYPLNVNIINNKEGLIVKNASKEKVERINPATTK